jgi:formamidopyrimidine-DNA glycosylase
MPELAEVEYYRKQWDDGLRRRIVAVQLHATKRIFRGANTKALQKTLTGATLLGSEAHGKQMLFRFSRKAWLGLHLGMTGKLQTVSSGSKPFAPAAHDHLVLRQAGRSLVFSDPRQFGRVLFHVGSGLPPWWASRPPALLSKEFTLARMSAFLARHRTAPLKAALLMQDGFPGIGNWMADEILWQAGLHPRRAAGTLLPAELKKVHHVIRSVCRTALRTVGQDFRDPPRPWLFAHRWERGGHCPRDAAALLRATIGGRTTCWCPRCQIED